MPNVHWGRSAKQFADASPHRSLEWKVIASLLGSGIHRQGGVGGLRRVRGGRRTADLMPYVAHHALWEPVTAHPLTGASLFYEDEQRDGMQRGCGSVCHFAQDSYRNRFSGCFAWAYSSMKWGAFQRLDTI